MPRLALIFGSLLSAVTIATIVYNGGYKSFSVFIPLILGTLLEAAGAIGMQPSLRKHAMHGAAAVSLLGGVSCLFMGFKQLMALSSDQPPSIDKIGSVWATAILCLTFLALCIRSFIQARRDREAAQAN